jgi:hypothetical protein
MKTRKLHTVKANLQILNLSKAGTSVVFSPCLNLNGL